jgi:hypothetical protein
VSVARSLLEVDERGDEVAYVHVPFIDAPTADRATGCLGNWSRQTPCRRPRVAVTS